MTGEYTITNENPWQERARACSTRLDAQLRRTAKLERALEKIRDAGYASEQVLPRLMAALAEEALDN